MKKSLLFILLVGILMSSMTSCRTSVKAVSVAPINVQVNFDMEDLEFIGDVTGTSTQSYVMGIALGGRKYRSGVLLSQSLGLSNLTSSRGYNNAMYDALMQMPNADFVLPVSFDSDVTQMFMGRSEVLTLRCKAYKIKNK